MRVAVVGATGAVGSTILGVMRERGFPADEIVPFASERSAGRTIDYGERDLTVQALSDEGINRLNIPFVNLAVVVVLAGLAGVVAAIPPARRAARLDVLRAIVTE